MWLKIKSNFLNCFLFVFINARLFLDYDNFSSGLPLISVRFFISFALYAPRRHYSSVFLIGITSITYVILAEMDIRQEDNYDVLLGMNRSSVNIISNVTFLQVTNTVECQMWLCGRQVIFFKRSRICRLFEWPQFFALEKIMMVLERV